MMVPDFQLNLLCPNLDGSSNSAGSIGSSSMTALPRSLMNGDDEFAMLLESLGSRCCNSPSDVLDGSDQADPHLPQESAAHAADIILGVDSVAHFLQGMIPQTECIPREQNAEINDAPGVQRALNRAAELLMKATSSLVPEATVHVACSRETSPAMVTYHVMLVEGEPPTVLSSLTEAQHDSSSQRPVVLPNHRTDSTTPLTVEPPPRRMDAPSESNAQSFDRAPEGTRPDHIDPQKSITQDLRELTPLALTPLADGANDHQELHTSSPNAIPTVTSTNDGLRSVLHATVTTLTHTRGTVARIVLYPESLGTIVVHLQPQVTGTAVQIVVSSAAALRLVEETVEALRSDLHASGVATDAIAVRMRDDRAAPLHPHQSTTELVLAIGDEHPERRRQRRSFSQRQRQHREHTQFDHFM
jgi:hypothetical protein